MKDILVKINTLKIASCNCLTKTPDVLYHNEKCRYRILSELEIDIKKLYEEIEFFKSIFGK
jgi:hypothetical protein